MKRCTITTRVKQWMLLVGYLAVLLPASQGHVLCINHCGDISITPEQHQCHGHEADHHHEHHHEHDHDHESQSGFPLFTDEHHNQNCCIDIPLGTNTVQLTTKTVEVPLQTNSVRGTFSLNPPPPRVRVWFPVAGLAPPDLEKLAGIVLLI